MLHSFYRFASVVPRLDWPGVLFALSAFVDHQDLVQYDHDTVRLRQQSFLGDICNQLLSFGTALHVQGVELLAQAA